MFFHGTTDRFLQNILDNGLLPAKITGNKCEKRQGNMDKVFLTKERLYAEGYALRAVIRHGGRPIILNVKAPDAVLERTGKIDQYVVEKATFESVEEVACVVGTYDALIERMLAIFNNLPHRADPFPPLHRKYGK